jgi:hypothetical protein
LRFKPICWNISVGAAAVAEEAGGIAKRLDYCGACPHQIEVNPTAPAPEEALQEAFDMVSTMARDTPAGRFGTTRCVIVHQDEDEGKRRR